MVPGPLKLIQDPEDLESISSDILVIPSEASHCEAAATRHVNGGDDGHVTS